MTLKEHCIAYYLEKNVYIGTDENSPVFKLMYENWINNYAFKDFPDVV